MPHTHNTVAKDGSVPNVSEVAIDTEGKYKYVNNIIINPIQILDDRWSGHVGKQGWSFIKRRDGSLGEGN